MGTDYYSLENKCPGAVCVTKWPLKVLKVFGIISHPSAIIKELEQLLYRELSSNTKISKFGMTLRIEQNISSLNISVNFAAQMKVFETFEGITQDCRYFVFCQGFLSKSHYIRYWPCTAVLHHYLKIENTFSNSKYCWLNYLPGGKVEESIESVIFNESYK